MFRSRTRSVRPFQNKSALRFPPRFPLQSVRMYQERWVHTCWSPQPQHSCLPPRFVLTCPNRTVRKWPGRSARMFWSNPVSSSAKMFSGVKFVNRTKLQPLSNIVLSNVKTIKHNSHSIKHCNLLYRVTQ